MLSVRSALVERLEVVADLIVEVARHLLTRDRVLHRLAVLADDAEVLKARGHGAAPSGQVGIVAVLAALPRLPLHAHVERVGAEALGGLALRVPAPAFAGHEPLAFAEILVLWTHAVAACAVFASPAALGLAPAAQALAGALRLVHRAHLVERFLHRLHGPIALAALERLHAFHGVAAPVATALATEALHLLEELTQLLGRDLIRAEAAGQRLRLAVDHLVLAVREVRLEIRHAVRLLEHAEPLVALLHEAVEVGARVGERGVLEDRRQIAGGRGAAAAGTLGEVALLEGRPLERVLGELARRFLEHGRARPLLALLFGGGQEIGQPARRQRNRRHDHQDQGREHREEQKLTFTRNDALDHALDLQALDPRDGVCDQRVDERRAVRTVGPLERRRDTVVQTERPVGDPRDVTAPDAPRGPVDDPRQSAQDHEARGDPRRSSGPGVLGQQDCDPGHRTPEGAAETVILGPAAADRPPNTAQEALDPCRPRPAPRPALS